MFLKKKNCIFGEMNRFINDEFFVLVDPNDPTSVSYVTRRRVYCFARNRFMTAMWDGAANANIRAIQDRYHMGQRTTHDSLKRILRNLRAHRNEFEADRAIAVHSDDDDEDEDVRFSSHDDSDWEPDFSDDSDQSDASMHSMLRQLLLLLHNHYHCRLMISSLHSECCLHAVIKLMCFALS